MASLEPPSSSRNGRLVGYALLVGAGACLGLVARGRAQQKTYQTLVAPYNAEEMWLISEVASDLSEMVAMGGGAVDAAHVPRVIVTPDGEVWSARVQLGSGGEIEVPLAPKQSTWSPEDYLSLTARLLGVFRLKPRPTVAPKEEELLASLLDLRADVIEDHNEALSKEWNSRSADPRFHEEAALLLGALALRESAGNFTDIRFLLCRMTAHLALARALRTSGTMSLSGKYAEALLATLAEREEEAERELQNLREAPGGKSEAQRAWQRVLRIRMSQDWRLLPDPSQGSLAERLEWLRAMDLTVGGSRALQILEKAHGRVGSEPDWAFLVVRDLGVETGQRFLPEAVAATGREADHIFSRTHGGTGGASDSIAALNEPAQRFVSKDGPRVIAWGTFAAFYQRHLLFLVDETQYLYGRMLGLEEEAKTWASKATGAFSRLALFPIVAASWEAEQKNPSPEPLERAIDLLSGSPDLITFNYWWGIEDKILHQPKVLRKVFPRESWFITGCVHGTTFEIGERWRGLWSVVTLNDGLSRLKAISPKSFGVNRLAIWARHGDATTLPEARAEFGERATYDGRALKDLARRAWLTDLPSYKGVEESLCTLDPDACLALGSHCVTIQDEACAVTSYERAIQEGADRVSVANDSGWIVKYYLRNKNVTRAKQIAEMAGEVYSAGGLGTLSAYLEETGDYIEAEKVIQQRIERYESQNKGPSLALMAFYYRMAHLRGRQDYEAKFRDLARETFPNGLEQISVSSLAGPPQDGVRVVAESAFSKRNGLHLGQIIVGLDGWRMRNHLQYSAIHAFSDDPDMRFVVWDKDQYLEVKARSYNRNFEINIPDYKPAPSDPSPP